jgi:Flp pilus assembly pilin Flp
MGRVRALLRRLRDEDGMNTAEYAVGTLAAVAFAGILLKVLTSDRVQAALTALVERALR